MTATTTTVNPDASAVEVLPAFAAAASRATGKRHCPPADLARRLAQMETELEQLDPALTREYRIAKDTVEHLVRTETPFLAFLRTEDYEPFKAATRLAQNWKYRNEIFGERWLLPMTQTGRGALSGLDVAMLHTGFFLTVTWKEARQSFVYVDHSRCYELEQRLGKLYTDCKMERCLFYQWTVETNEVLQTEGVSGFFLVTSKKQPDIVYRPNYWKVVKGVLPIRIKSLTVVQAYEDGKEHLLEFLRARQVSYTSYNTRLRGLEVAGNSVRATLQQLLDYGFDRSHIPSEVGGSMDYDSTLDTFIRTRLQIEEVAHLRSPSMRLSRGYTPPTMHDLVIHQTSLYRKRTKRPRNGSETEHEIVTAKKARNALYARRHYYRNKITCIALEQEVKYLEKINARERAEHQRLEGLCQQASCVLLAVASGSSGPHVEADPNVNYW